ncbi:hypothetical protein ACTFSJ_28985 [Bacillus cereus group sp. MYBK12-2]|nr:MULTISPECIES: hypothetical protein [Bacillus]MDA1532040.1 hypothetical protein [Bacillus cereus group sp. TH260-2LC]HDR7931576.1 hypothetical protein [Bacillus pacificus]KMP85633.1 hypothetical protein TU63_16955 [Bacillus cereus]KYP99963.1 hypothetical protein B4079_4880 [Bacillus cereus]MCC2342355.1 hypothetical protein [Bacillus tropicus]
MLSISKKMYGMKIKQIFFLEKDIFPIDSRIDLVGITQSTIPMEGLIPIETLQKDLTKNEEELFNDISKSTRKRIKQVQKNENLQKIILTEPSNQEILLFQNFYNQFAKKKKTHLCSPYHVETLKLLRDQQALIITKIKDVHQQQTLCYRVYAADGKRAMPFYSVSHYRLTHDTHFRKLVGNVHCLLIWENIIWFKNRGYQIYDSGGLTKNPNIRNFKLKFGGEIITEYSGYLANSLLGKAALRIRKWKLATKNRGE